MLKIVEINSEERFEELRQKENSNCDYLYICKHCNTIKLSDNGILKNFTQIVICETQEEYDNITEKENILYVVKINDTTCVLYFGNILIYNTQEELEQQNALLQQEVNDLEAILESINRTEEEVVS